MKLVLAFAVLLSAVPIWGDSVQIGGHADFFDQQIVNSEPLGGPTVELFNTSFDYDTVSQQISDMSFTASGLLGKHFTFSGVDIIPISGSTSYDAVFNWSNRRAIIDLTIPSFDLPTAESPISNLIGGTKPFLLQCLTNRCESNFGPNGFSFIDVNGEAGATFLGRSPSPSPVPEPSSLSLLGIGLFGVGLLMRRKAMKAFGLRRYY